uniref:non-specific serine/threonine protein kinase n=1 Tax=Trichobilharzia regenti TaxID=157069 RepID=A0AA85JVK6_TRIRE|nr:unnamed protein product [Trichobilharzia regenti]
MEVDASSMATCAPEVFDIASTLVNVEEVTEKQSFEVPASTPDVVPVAEPVNHDAEPGTISKTPETVTSDPVVVPPVVNNNVGKYRLLRTIGKGNFAKVKLAIHMATGVEVAIKIINKTVMDNTLLKRLKREITIMKVTNHPNIVKLLEIIENEDVLCLVMEYASGGEIFDYLVANGKMREKEARIKFRQLLSAMQYCHAKRIVHRDLKAENILLDQNLNVKVADFGLANTFEYDQRLTTFCGSPPYAAPELFLGIPYYGPGVDIWSLGVILFTLVLGHLPFDARDLRELRSKILGLHYTIPRGSVSPECDALLRKMLVLDPKDRSSLKSLMQDKWVNMGYAPGDHLRPYKEPPKSQLDDSRVKAMEEMGFTRKDLESSVVNPEFDHVYATYHLLPETPSQFVELCKEVDPASAALPNTAVLSNALYTNDRQNKGIHDQAASNTESTSSTKSTAIGRFTVAPSVKTNEHTSQYPRSSLTSESNQTTGNQKNASTADSGNREHHSLTSTLPVALRRAFMQMGRTIAGGGAASTSNEDSITRANAQSNTARHNKPTPKTAAGGRGVITAAPVPIGAVKKHGFGTPQQQHLHKRLPANQHHPPSGPLDNTDGSPANHSATLRHVAPRDSQDSLKPDSSSPRAHPSSNTSSISSGSHKASPPQKANRIASEAEKPISDTSHRSVNTTARENDKSSAHAATHKRGTTDTNGMGPPSSSSTSSDSYGECELRETAATLVQGVWKSVDASSLNPRSPQQTPSELKRKVQNDGRLSQDMSEQYKGHMQSEQSGLRNEKSEISRSLTTIDQADQTVNVTWSDDAAKTVNTPPLTPQMKVSHTVQGTEAVALRQEALRLQSTHSATKTPSDPRSSINYAVDSSHQTTWGRGVLKALGGFFVQSKSTDVRQDSSSTRPLNKPREVRFPWSVYTTSTKTAEELLKSIIHALEVTPGCRYSYDPHLPFLLQCSWAADRPALKTSTSEADSKGLTNTQFSSPLDMPTHGGLMRGDPVHWEMEVCQLPRVHLRGVRLKRIRGSTLHFRPIADLVMKSLRL